MASIQEKDLVFDFPDNWVFTKYDESVHHKTRLNKVQGFQAVDIIAMPVALGTLLLLEVKDFRRSITDSGRCSTYDEYITSVANKVLNTIAGLYTAHRILDEQLRQFSARLMKTGTTIEAVFFMEELPLPPSPSYNYRYAFVNARTKLIGMLDNIGLSVEVYSLSQLPAANPWTVTDRYAPVAVPGPVIPSRHKKKK